MENLQRNTSAEGLSQKNIINKGFKYIFDGIKKALRYPFKKGFFRNAKMQNKLILSFLALSFFPLAISGVFSASNSSRTIREKISTYSLQLVNQVSQNISTSLIKVKGYSDEIIISPDVNNRLLGYKNASDADKTEIRAVFSKSIQLKFLNTSSVDDVLMVFINDEKNNQYEITHVGMQFRWKKEEIERIIQLNSQKENVKNFTLTIADIEGTEGKDIVIGRQIRNGLYSGILGHLFVAVNQEYLRNVYRSIDIGKGSDIFIMNSDGVVISGKKDNVNLGYPFPERKLIEQINKSSQQNNGTFSLKIGREDHLIAYSKVENTNLYTVSTIPYSYLNSETSKFSYSIAFLTIIILILAIAVSIIISRGISAPLKKLEKNMARFGEGKLNNSIEVDRGDEIGHLQESFNAMAADIKELLIKIEEENRLRRMTELKVLEYQINPHFLYNTLDSINWMAQKAGQKEIGAMVTALARFFRLGLSKGKDNYTIKDEIEHVHNYLIICKIRYKECFEFSIDVDKIIMDFRTPKIILQPLVENAIKHGIDKSGNGGHIQITGRKEEDNIILEVIDNGNGIDKERQDYINKSLTEMKETSSEESGFGLLNVHQRIRLNYGERYGVLIESTIGEGTRVRITLPSEIK